MKLWELESELQEVQPFEDPKIKWEQYMTTAHLAAQIIYTAENSYEDIVGKRVLDLGCGTGILSIGAALMGAEYVLGIDIDADALAIARENIKNAGVERVVDLININAADFVNCMRASKARTALSSPPAKLSVSRSSKKQSKEPSLLFDTVLLNPPFGTRNKGADMEFLKIATQLCSGSVYSLHKTSTRKHVVSKAESWGFKTSVVAELRYDLQQSYSFHKKQSKDIEVDLVRLTSTN